MSLVTLSNSENVLISHILNGYLEHYDLYVAHRVVHFEECRVDIEVNTEHLVHWNMRHMKLKTKHFFKTLICVLQITRITGHLYLILHLLQAQVLSYPTVSNSENYCPSPGFGEGFFYVLIHLDTQIFNYLYLTNSNSPEVNTSGLFDCADGRN